MTNFLLGLVSDWYISKPDTKSSQRVGYITWCGLHHKILDI